MHDQSPADNEPEHRDHAHHQHAGPTRVSTQEERALLAPFVDDLHNFLRRALAGVDGPIVEVGAGDGVIADRLRADGFDIVAIDADAETAKAATDQGRPVTHADWLRWDGGGHAPFAAVVFTRSLHHIDPIEQAVEQLLRLAPGGLVIADEFGYELVDPAGAQFLVDAWALLAAAGLRDDDPTVAADPLAAWSERMTVDHHITASHHLLEAVRSVGDIEQMGHGRMLAQLAMFGVDPSHPHAAAIRDVLVATEDARLAAGTMAKIGLRFIARLRS